MTDAIKAAILNGLYDQNFPGNELVGPEILSNNQHEKIWLALREELYHCKSFTWAVAFITQDMLVPFKAVMADLASKNVKGTLITGSYLNFNSPRVFKELKKIPNLKIKLAQTAGFHAKGYLFEHEHYQTIIIGSANFTRAALLSNYEWALKISSRSQAALTKQLARQLAVLKQNSITLTASWLSAYQKSWLPPLTKPVKKAKSIIVPNQMQTAALKKINALVNEGAKRGLIVSATGTGKTYLGAFAVKAFKPRRFLYIVHREQIARKSLRSFYQVIGGRRRDYGLLAGKQHQLDKKYLFATVQTISQPQVLKQFAPNEFDYLLIDEAHRAAAPSYQRVLNYFKPRFCLGMTATPERMDKQNVYQIFDYHLAYEIRLRDALKEKMLTPFHYVGVQDYEVAGREINETTKLKDLVSSERVDYILKEMDYYGYCGKKPKGLVFCSRQAEARQLALAFTNKGYPAVALTNEDSEKSRQQAVQALLGGKIEYIITVDLFNEGVDLPALNQIIMLRNTKSSIIFIQQLGRGLRKFPGKNFVTVLDFIGNYKNNYLIPIALHQDTSRDRDRVRRETRLPGLLDVSTISFSRVATAKILHSLDQVKLDGLRELRQNYQNLKQKLGRMPFLFDFDRYGSVSPLVFAQQLNLNNYGAFLAKMGEKIKLDKYENQILTFLTKELLNGKRPHELLLLKLLLQKRRVKQADYLTLLKHKHAYVNTAVLASVERILTLAFFDIKQGKTTKKKQYGNRSLIKQSNRGYELADSLQAALNHDQLFRKLFLDVIKTGLQLSKKYDYQQQFTLDQQYNRKDVCRLLNWPQDVSAPMYGYRVGETATPIFITYQKDSAKKRNALYQNTLEGGRSLKWYTRTPRYLSSPEVQRLLHTPQMKLYLFVKRSDAAGKQFFYLGQVKIQPKTVQEEYLGAKKKAVVSMHLLLQQPLNLRMRELLFE